MKDFKFLTKNDKTIFNGQMSREVIQYLYDYTNNITRYEMTTTIATYKIADYVYAYEMGKRDDFEYSGPKVAED